MKEKNFSVEISDVFEPEQENAVIEAVREYVKKNPDELREHFRSIDTIEVEGLAESDARAIRERLEHSGVSLRVRGSGAGEAEDAGSGARASVTCPQCGAVLESLDWRCPECFYEFPEYEYKDEVE